MCKYLSGSFEYKKASIEIVNSSLCNKSKHLNQIVSINLNMIVMTQSMYVF